MDDNVLMFPDFLKKGRELSHIAASEIRQCSETKGQILFSRKMILGVSVNQVSAH